MGKPGPKFCLDNENKTKKKEKNLRFWRGTEKKYFPSFSNSARFSDFFFSNVIQSTIHAQHLGMGRGVVGQQQYCEIVFSLSWPQKLLI
jgi:hypothetical protein